MGVQENECQISQELNTVKILKISCVRRNFVKFDFHFLGLPMKFSLVLLQITNYIFSP